MGNEPVPNSCWICAPWRSRLITEPDSESTHTHTMREGATGNKNFPELGGKMFAARKGLRSQGTPASHEQGRLVLGKSAGREWSKTPAGKIEPQHCARRMVKHRAALLCAAASGYPQVKHPV
jgi:hypothetical protein